MTEDLQRAERSMPAMRWMRFKDIRDKARALRAEFVTLGRLSPAPPLYPPHPYSGRAASKSLQARASTAGQRSPAISWILGS
jgi:hypothetical protein